MSRRQIVTTIARQSQFHAILAPSMPPNPIAVFETSKGTFKAELFLDKTPVTASNIVDLARNGFYDGLHIHRVIEGFMLVRASRRPVSIDVKMRRDVFVVESTLGVDRSRAMKTTDEIHSIHQFSRNRSNSDVRTRATRDRRSRARAVPRRRPRSRISSPGRW